VTPATEKPKVGDAASLVDYARSLDCIHCGLCLNTCPTYQLTGAEPSSPRGRIHLMRAVAEDRLEADRGFEEEMDFCLVCRHCESVCPAGVEFGAMMEFARDGLMSARRHGPLVHVARWVGFRRVLPSRALLRICVALLGLAQRAGLVRLLAPLLGARGAALRHMPAVPPRAERRPLEPRIPAQGAREGAVAMLAGCVMPELYGRVNRATARCLAAAGLEVQSAPGHVCCGALHAHNGDLAGARALARSTIAAFEALEHTQDDARAPLEVVVNSAGCGAHMKEYARVLEDDAEWSARAAAFAARVVDVSEVLVRPAPRARLSAALARTRAERWTYDDPCHLCHGQEIRDEPRALLDLVPGAERVELEDSESCCGSAGIYSLLRPKDSARVFARKLAAFDALDALGGVRSVVTANPGCHLQWETGLARAGRECEVLHLAEALARHLP